MPGLRFLTDAELMKRCNFALEKKDDPQASELFAEMQRRDKITQTNLKTIDGRNTKRNADLETDRASDEQNGA